MRLAKLWQIVTLKKGRGQHSKYLPYAFTEPGIAMLSSILNSKTAIQVNIEIIRAFVLLRQLSISNKEIFDKISELENRYNQHFDDIFEAINYLLKKDTQVKKQEERKRIGF